MYKRFMVFRCESYYPSGGLDDCNQSFDEVKDAIEYIISNPANDCWYQLFDRVAGIQIEEFKEIGVKYNEQR